MAAKVLAKWTDDRGQSAARRLPVRGRAGLMPLHLALSTAAAFLSLAAMIFSGVTVPIALPAVAATFATMLTLCLAVREAGLTRDNRKRFAASYRMATGAETLNLIAGLVTRHDAAGLLLSMHGADRKAFGFSVEQADPSAYLDAIHVGGRIAYLSAIDELRQGARRATAEFLFSFGAGEGAYRPVRAVLVAEPCDGVFAGFVAHTSDISGEAALKNDAQVWKVEARSANDAKTRFLAAVSHELRTPLNAILGFSDILIGEYFGKFENERQKEYVTLINQSGHHLLAVVNSMLDMSKIEAGRYELIKEPFHIGEAIRVVDDMLALQARAKGVVLTTRVARGVGDVVADRRAIQQILINLANNAIKFTAEGGVVAIDANSDGRSLVLCVSDTGIGIPAEKLALIGRPFMQVQNDYARQYEGTGLGLALVKGLVALHGGTFDITSQEGAGTIITITVPMDGEGDAGADTVEFPPRLKEKNNDTLTGENRHGNPAQAKIA
jgi:cell cycle sensor histidine kinase DivJ